MPKHPKHPTVADLEGEAQLPPPSPGAAGAPPPLSGSPKQKNDYITAEIECLIRSFRFQNFLGEHAHGPL